MWSYRDGKILRAHFPAPIFCTSHSSHHWSISKQIINIPKNILEGWLGWETTASSFASSRLAAFRSGNHPVLSIREIIQSWSPTSQTPNRSETVYYILLHQGPASLVSCRLGTVLPGPDSASSSLAMSLSSGSSGIRAMRMYAFCIHDGHSVCAHVFINSQKTSKTNLPTHHARRRPPIRTYAHISTYMHTYLHIQTYV